MKNNKVKLELTAEQMDLIIDQFMAFISGMDIKESPSEIMVYRMFFMNSIYRKVSTKLHSGYFTSNTKHTISFEGVELFVLKYMLKDCASNIIISSLYMEIDTALPNVKIN